MTKSKKVERGELYELYMRTLQRFMIILMLMNSAGMSITMLVMYKSYNIIMTASLVSFCLSLTILLLMYFVDVCLSFGRYAFHVLEDVHILNGAAYYFASSAFLGGALAFTLQGVLLGLAGVVLA